MTLTIEAHVPSVREAMRDALDDGKVILYPTDTVYGLGCDATREDAVARVYAMKGRDARPVSVIAPSLDWIRAHCSVPGYAEELLAQLPGAYTFIFTLKEPSCVAAAVLQERTALGVRIPAHWCSDVVAAFGKPVVTTSANISGEPVVRDVHHLPLALRAVDLAIDDGKLGGNPSTVIDCTGSEPKTLR